MNYGVNWCRFDILAIRRELVNYKDPTGDEGGLTIAAMAEVQVAIRSWLEKHPSSKTGTVMSNALFGVACPSEHPPKERTTNHAMLTPKRAPLRLPNIPTERTGPDDRRLYYGNFEESALRDVDADYL